MSDETRAELLARWLEAEPGTGAPDDLDPDVVEAIYALRPDLAPPPSLTADDILASVTTGPLAEGAEPVGGEVVPFPGAPESEVVRPEPAVAPERTPWWRSANRWGGLGVMAAIAATLILAVLPVLETAQEPAATAADAPAARQAPAEEPAAPAVVEPEVATTGAKESAPRAAKPLAKAAPRPMPAPAPAAPTPTPEAAELDAVADLDDADLAGAEGFAAGARDERNVIRGREEAPEPKDTVYEMEERAAANAPDPIPELSSQQAKSYDLAPASDAEQLDREAAAMAPEEASGGLFSRRGDKKKEAAEPQAAPASPPPPAAQDVVQAAPPSKQAAASEPVTPAREAITRADAVPNDTSTRWRGTLDATTLQKIDVALGIADASVRAGDPASGAAALEPYIHPPAIAGQVVADRAARLYLQAGRASAAVAVAQRGLALSTANTPERSALLVTYGDALLQQGDAAGAEAAWRDAAELNAAR